jgi:hypothetical protein
MVLYSWWNNTMSWYIMISSKSNIPITNSCTNTGVPLRWGGTRRYVSYTSQTIYVSDNMSSSTRPRLSLYTKHCWLCCLPSTLYRSLENIDRSSVVYPSYFEPEPSAEDARYHMLRKRRQYNVWQNPDMDLCPILFYNLHASVLHDISQHFLIFQSALSWYFMAQMDHELWIDPPHTSINLAYLHS